MKQPEAPILLIAKHSCSYHKRLHGMLLPIKSCLQASRWCHSTLHLLSGLNEMRSCHWATRHYTARSLPLHDRVVAGFAPEHCHLLLAGWPQAPSLCLQGWHDSEQGSTTIAGLYVKVRSRDIPPEGLMGKVSSMYIYCPP